LLSKGVLGIDGINVRRNGATMLMIMIMKKNRDGVLL
jgi:hypothetical protein